MTESLFRREVLDARNAGWLGSISLTQPLRLWVLTGSAVAAAVCVALFLSLGTYTRRSQVVGQLVPSSGLSTVMAPATGVVSRLDTNEGDEVGAGHVLAVVSVPRATLASGDAMAALQRRLQERQHALASAHTAQQELLDAQSQGLADQRANADRELAQINTEIATRQDQARIAHETLERMRQLTEGNFISPMQLKQQQAAALEQIGAVQALERQAIMVRRLLAQLQQAQRELPGQRRAAQGAYERDLAELQQERIETEARGALVVSAPVSGVVATQLAKLGQAVEAGQPLLSLLPGDGTLEAELLVPSRAIGFVEPGDRVTLRYQAFPFQKFGHQEGRVVRISRSALNAGELGVLRTGASDNEPFYRITVDLQQQFVTAYGRQEALRPGMVIDADILGERRRLIEWVFEPLYSLTGRIRSE
jgi:membrane fusion protein